MSNTNEAIDDGPPVIPRYDAQPAYVTSSQTNVQKQPIRGQPIRTLTVPSNKVLVLKRPDGTTAYLRAVNPSDERIQAARSGQTLAPHIRTSVTTGGGASIVGTAPAGTRILRISSASPRGFKTGGGPSQRFVPGQHVSVTRAIYPVGQGQSTGSNVKTTAGNMSAYHQQLAYQGTTSRTHPSTTAGAVVQPRNRPVPYYAYAGGNSIRMLAPPKSYRFEFENNEDEDRAISEAIAREEEIMRREEEDKLLRQHGGGTQKSSWDATLDEPVPQNLKLRATDSPTCVQVKSLLTDVIDEVVRMQLPPQSLQQVIVGRRVVGPLGRPMLLEQKRYQTKKTPSPYETLVAQHMERLKKEINKRRTALENAAEEQVGLLAPWRKAKGRPGLKKSQQQQQQQQQRQAVALASEQQAKETTPINPADISLIPDDAHVESVIGRKESGARRRQMSPEVVKTEEYEEFIGAPSGSQEPSQAQQHGYSYKPEPKRRGRPPKHAKRSEEPEEDNASIAAVKEEPPEESQGEGPNPNKNHCLCNKPYDSTKFYIACDSCHRWYHGRCVNVSEKKALRLSGWQCGECEESGRIESDRKLYCVCRTPYNNNKVYVGCDKCDNWFHPECVGITIEQAEQIPTYTCPPCEATAAQRKEEVELVRERVKHQQKRIKGLGSPARQQYPHVLSRNDYQALWRIVERVFEDAHATPLKDDNTPKDCDLRVIVDRMTEFHYQTLIEFVHDVRTLLDRGKVKVQRSISDSAHTLSRLFERELANEMDTPETHATASTTTTTGGRQRGISISLGAGVTDQSLDIDTDQLIDMNIEVDPHTILL